MKAYAIEVHAGIGATPVYLFRDSKGKLTTTPQFRNATKFEDFTTGREMLVELMECDHKEMRRIIGVDKTFTSHVAFLLQCWARMDTSPVIHNVMAQRLYQFHGDV